MNAPDPPDWTLNSCFGASRSIWVHLAMFHYCMKHGPKRAELVQLMQKFVPRCRVVIFRNERTRSTPLGNNSSFGVFRSVWMYLGSFHYLMKLGPKRVELVQLM